MKKIILMAHSSKLKNKQQNICLILALMAVSFFTIAAVPVYTIDKDDLDAHTRAVITKQDAFLERSSSYPDLPLQRRTIKSSIGIDAALEEALPSTRNPIKVIAKLSEFPSSSNWSSWKGKGVDYLEYMGHQYWLVEISTDLNRAYELMHAYSFSKYLITDKLAVIIDEYNKHTEFYDEINKLLVLDIKVQPENPDAAEILKTKYHIDGHTYEDQSGLRTVTLVIDANRFSELVNQKEAFFINPGSWKNQELMQGIRTTVNANPAIGLDNQVLTGKGIKLANNEGIGGGLHEDFWIHDSFGEPIQGRWTEYAGIHCLNGIPHGVMTAGVLMGNGWSSLSTGFDLEDPLQFRGLAPNATFECYSQSQARAHASSYSRVQGGSSAIYNYNSLFDDRVIGLSGAQYYHPQTVALGNNGLGAQYGIETGYFSILNPYKNQMGVGNGQNSGLINPHSSMGPTFDGRIKPDVVAPTGRVGYENGVFNLEIGYIWLERNGEAVYQWYFDENTPNWHQGWGNADNSSFSQLYLTMDQSIEGTLQLAINEGPWGTAWTNKPLIGTQVIPYNQLNGGDPLNFVGHEDDVLHIKYRSNSPTTGVFELITQWFRSFPITMTSDWYSQGLEHVYAYGNGQWNLATIPVGQSERFINNPLEPWTGDYTWKDNPIQHLSLRFNRTGIEFSPNNPNTYQSAGGTSAASPVVAGSYALALEHLIHLYPDTILDYQDVPSVYYSDDPSKGRLLNSTLKALFIHTANDMTSDGYQPLPDNLDTLAPTIYQSGPDYVSGYGMINTQKAVDLMTLDKQNQGFDTPFEINEKLLGENGCDVYKIPISKQLFKSRSGLKVTVVWDDASASSGSAVTVSKLVNNIGLVLIDPAGNYYYPWSIDLPYDIQSPGNGPHQVEPEPINASDMVAARRDIPNDRDNVEQVLIDDVSVGEPGIWRALVVDNGIATTDTGQKYSIVISPVDPL